MRRKIVIENIEEMQVCIREGTDANNWKIEEMLKNAIREVPGGILVYEIKNGRINIFYHNKEILELFGFSQKDITDRRSFFVRELVDQRDFKKMRQSLAEREKNQGDFTCEFRIINRERGYRWICFRERIVESSGKPNMYIAVMLDITGAKEKELSAKKLAIQSKYLYEHDSLTGLYRKEAFEKRAYDLIHQNPDIDYVFVRWDAEHFKLVNEMSGYEVGNQLLIRAADLINEFLGLEGVGARLGSDHFVLCFPEKMLNIEKSFQKIQRVLDGMHFDYNIRVYAGIYVVVDREEPVDFMCDKAALALHSIKGKYMETHAYYNEEMMQSMLKEQEVKNDMWDALKGDQFKVYVQPKFDVLSGRIVGGEALVRWKHPDKGFVNPVEFIPFFERSGFISNMDQYVWEHVAEYLQSCMANKKRVLPISVNVSRVDFYRENLLDYFVNLLDSHKLSAKYMEIEVTESAYVTDEEVLYETLEQLQQAGFSILVDDFGSGYSSFGMMKNAPVDVLKLDMEFLRGIDNNDRGKTIVKHMVEMAKELVLPVIAEGVETAEHVELLREIGCDYAQGFYYSKPVPLEEYDEMVQGE
ncbi:MAG: EAL domain-containing protein [Roseburia sp.]|nr:EAL domain-containing protein [Roseburia sp.]